MSDKAKKAWVATLVAAKCTEKASGKACHRVEQATER
jgi:hypothetical protein